MCDYCCFIPGGFTARDQKYAILLIPLSPDVVGGMRGIWGKEVWHSTPGVMGSEAWTGGAYFCWRSMPSVPIPPVPPPSLFMREGGLRQGMGDGEREWEWGYGDGIRRSRVTACMLRQPAAGEACRNRRRKSYKQLVTTITIRNIWHLRGLFF